jgi:hypothetical protein
VFGHLQLATRQRSTHLKLRHPILQATFSGCAIIAGGACAMPVSKVPAWGWMQISFVIVMFSLSLWIASYLWHGGARIVAITPLMIKGEGGASMESS